MSHVTRHAAAVVGRRRQSVRRSRPRRCVAMTIMELLLALAAMGLVGAAIASMLSAVAYGTDTSNDMRSLVVKSKTLSARMTAHVRKARMVLDHGSEFLVLWVVDEDEDDTPSLQEIERIEWDASTDELVRYTASKSAKDTEYKLSDDFGNETKKLKGSGDFPRRVWGRAVTNWDVTLDDSDPQKAALVSFRLTLAAGSSETVAVNAAALRN